MTSLPLASAAFGFFIFFGCTIVLELAPGRYEGDDVEEYKASRSARMFYKIGQIVGALMLVVALLHVWK